jgi:hypothetical protein
MMMERVKTAPAPEETAKPPPNPETTASKPAPSSSQERVEELERRLNDLDSAMNETVDDTERPAVVPVSDEAPVAKPNEEQKQPAVGTGKNNPLLVR